MGERILNEAFVRTYPKFRRARPVADCLSSTDCRCWRGYAELMFPEYGYCAAVKGFEAADAELQARKVVLPTFDGEPESRQHEDPVLDRRDERLMMLINKAYVDDYPPAWLKLADLIRRGDVFNAGPEIELYALMRACGQAHACEDMAPRIEALRGRLTADRVAVVEWTVRYPGGRLEALLQGEPLTGRFYFPTPPEPEGLDPGTLILHQNGRRFESKPAREMMSEDDYARYRVALDALDCGQAAEILNAAFVATYPQYHRVRYSKTCSDMADCSTFLLFAKTEYPEYSYCMAVTELAAEETRLREQKVALAKYAPVWPRGTRDRLEPLLTRDGHLYALVTLAARDHAPALVKLADLVRRGDLFDAGAEVEYFLLRRACDHGLDCRALASRIAGLRDAIPKDRLDVIDVAVGKQSIRGGVVEALVTGHSITE